MKSKAHHSKAESAQIDTAGHDDFSWVNILPIFTMMFILFVSCLTAFNSYQNNFQQNQKYFHILVDSTQKELETLITLYDNDPEKIIENIAKRQNKKLGYSIYKDDSERTLVYRSHSTANNSEHEFTHTTHIMSGARNWVIEWYTSEDFVPPAGYNSFFYILFLGLTLAAAVYFAMESVIRTKESKEKKALNEVEKTRQQMALHAGDLGIWDIDLETGFTFMSERWCTMLGYEWGDLEQDLSNCFKLIHPEDVEKFQTKIDQHSSGESDEFECELRMICKDGSYKWMFSKGKAIARNQDGVATRIIGTTLDITDRKTAEAELQKRTEMLELAEETASLGHWRVNVQNNQTFWSEETYRIFGLSSESYTPSPQSIYEFCSEQESNEIRDILKNAIKEKKPFEFVACIDRPHQNKIYIQANGKPQLDEEENVKTIFGICQDITRQKEYEIQIEQANKLKSEFLANISHEIRTPMNGIIGTASLLKNTKMDDIQKKYTDLIVSSGDTLLDIISDVLDLSKIEAGKLETHTDSIDLKLLLDETVELHKASAIDKDIEITLDYHDDTPQFIKSDRLRIKQILSNFLSNSIKFTENGKIDVRVYLNKKSIRFDVIDTGIGIPEDKQHLLFKNFSQVYDDKDRAKLSGAGLGLSITKGLAKLLDGEVGCTSKENEGSTFWLSIPVVEGDKVNSQTKHDQTEQNKLKKLKARVLLTEDVETNQLIIGDMLEQLGLEYDIAENGKIAVDMSRENKYDLIIMDLRMPVMGGIEACKIIRKDLEEQNRWIPIVALTAYAMNDSLQDCLDAGMDDFMTKPVKIDVFTGTIGYWLDPDNQSNIEVEEKLHDNQAENSEQELNNQVDTSFLDSIKADNENQAKKFAQAAIRDMDKNIAALENALRNNIHEDIVSYAHAMKSVAASIGANEFSNLAKRVETEYKAENTDQDILDIIQSMPHLFINIRKILSSYAED